jgi:hypothetical protein
VVYSDVGKIMEKFIEELVKVKVKSKFSESKILLLKLLGGN